jgi:hypothetical protein
MDEGLGSDIAERFGKGIVQLKDLHGPKVQGTEAIWSDG